MNIKDIDNNTLNILNTHVPGWEGESDLIIIGTLIRSIKNLESENDKLRAHIAKSNLDCMYCGLPYKEMNKCNSGFPGCARMDDLLND